MTINYTISNNIAILSWNMTSLPMNVLNDESVPAFGAALEKAYSDADVRGIIITSDKPEFVAGADLKMILIQVLISVAALTLHPSGNCLVVVAMILILKKCNTSPCPSTGICTAGNYRILSYR